MTVGGRIFAAIAVLFWAILPGFGLIDLSTMFVEDSYYAEVAALETSWGVLTTFAVALPFGWAACRPRDVWPVLALLWLTTAALLLGALLGFSFGPVVMPAVVGSARRYPVPEAAAVRGLAAAGARGAGSPLLGSLRLGRL